MGAASANGRQVFHLVSASNDRTPIVTTNIRVRDCPPAISDALVEWFDAAAQNFMDMVENPAVCPPHAFLVDPETGYAIASRPERHAPDADLLSVINWLNSNRGTLNIPVAFECRGVRAETKRALICPITANGRLLVSVIPF